jgi:DNA repair exonuclease SbcCD ATPase subunit
MKIEFEDLVFKNVFSYGDIENTFVFNKGINLITNNKEFRSNGVGKSSSLLTILLALFGKTPKKTIQSDIQHASNFDPDQEIRTS